MGKSEDHRMDWVERDLKDHLTPTPLPLDQAGSERFLPAHGRGVGEG